MKTERMEKKQQPRQRNTLPLEPLCGGMVVKGKNPLSMEKETGIRL